MPAAQWGLWFGLAVLCGLGVWWWRSRARTTVAPPQRPVTLVGAGSARAAILAKLVPARPRAEVEQEDPRRLVPRPPELPAPQFKERPKSEWQGMRIDLSVAPACESTELCPFGQVCKPGACGPGEPPDADCRRCLPCESDRECLRGEVCVLDHCVKQELVSCRSAADCPAGVPCVLSGYSKPPRHNDGMRAYCPDIDGPGEPPGDEFESEPSERAAKERPPTLHQKLEEKLRRSWEEEP